MLRLLAAALVVGLATASCPNACSGHGSCGEFDMCTCHTNYEGGDCSQRVCPFNWAWITTPQGDLNFDGDRYSGTTFDDTHEIRRSDAWLVTQRFKGGAWENWPLHAQQGEGHFYMECSNRGLCDRKTGQCQCFEGYTGEACRRAVCPDDCSGHGTCKTLAQIASAESQDYRLWDRDMQRSCSCDAGYVGPACAERVCPYGDDVLTTGQNTEAQWVGAFSTGANALGKALKGNIALSYTDYYGQTWTSSYFAVDSSDMWATNSDGLNAIETDAANALKNLPNAALKDGVASVKVGPCSTAHKGSFDIDAAGGTIVPNTGSAAMPDGAYIYCESFDAEEVFEYAAAGTFTSVGGGAYAGSGSNGNYGCKVVAYLECVGLEVRFGGQISGDLKDLTIETDQLTVDGNTNFQVDTGIAAFTYSTMQLGDSVVDAASGGVEATFTHSSAVTHGCDNDATCSIVSGSIGVTSGASNFHPDNLVEIVCDTKSFGTFTIATSTNDDTLTVDEYIPDCGDGLVTVNMVTNFITINTDVSNDVAVGDRIGVASWIVAGAGSSTAVTAVHWYAGDNAGFSHVFIEGDSFGLDSDGNAISLADSGAAANDYVFIDGQGTTESNECSDRGLCDRETGICNCFKSYTGDACQIQNALKA